MSDAADLSSLYFQWSQAVDDYREKNASTLTSDQKVRLKDLSNHLDDLSTHFTLADVAGNIASIQAEVNQIKTVTANAKKTLKRLNTVDMVMKGVAAVVAMGLSASSGNAGGVLGGVDDLLKLLKPIIAAVPASSAASHS